MSERTEMNQPPLKDGLPSALVLIGVLCSSLTSIVSVAYIILYVIAIIYRYNCEAIPDEDPLVRKQLWQLIFQVYIQDANICGAPPVGGLMTTGIAFVMIVLGLCVSIIMLLLSIYLFTVVVHKGAAKYIDSAVYGYIAAFVATLAADVTYGTFLGIDYTYVTSTLNMDTSWSESVSELELTRIGAFLLMTIVLKGYVIHIVTVVLLISIVIQLMEYKKVSENTEHSIHKVGALNAFDQRRLGDNNWSQSSMNFMPPYPRGGRFNDGYVNDEEPARSTLEMRHSNMYANAPYDRSNSWHRAEPSPSAPRPFSYLEEIRRKVPVQPPIVPKPPSPRRRDHWNNGPPVPDPDYSPDAPRKLNPPFDRSRPWQRSQPNLSAPRPYSYLEEIRSKVPVHPPIAPLAPIQRPDPWNTAPSAPNYSTEPRNLKSALKSPYI